MADDDLNHAPKKDMVGEIGDMNSLGPDFDEMSQITMPQEMRSITAATEIGDDLTVDGELRLESPSNFPSQAILDFNVHDNNNNEDDISLISQDMLMNTNTMGSPTNFMEDGISLNEQPVSEGGEGNEGARQEQQDQQQQGSRADSPSNMSAISLPPNLYNQINLGSPEELEIYEKINSGEWNIFDAARHNDAEKVIQILDTRPELVNQRDWGNCTPLQLACMLRSYDVIEKLIEKGAAPKQRDPIGRLPFEYIREPNRKAYMQRVADRYDKDNEDFLDDDSTIAGDNNAIRDAAFKGDMAECDRLLKKNSALISVKDKKGHSPIMFACMGQQIDCCYFLLERGANLYDKTNYGMTGEKLILDRVNRNKVQTFAFKVSQKGKAMSAAMFTRRKAEVKEAIEDKTATVMNDVRQTILKRETFLMQKAKALTMFATDWAEGYYIQFGMRNAEDELMRRWQWKQDELGREEETRQMMEKEEAEMRHFNFQQDQIARRLAQLEKERREREAAERARRLEEERLERERNIAEARAAAHKVKQEASYRRAEKQALTEWEAQEQAERIRDWRAHCDKKNHRLKLYQRMRFAVTSTVNSATKGAFVPKDNKLGNPTKLLRETVPVINYGRDPKTHYVDMDILSEEEKNKTLGLHIY